MYIYELLAKYIEVTVLTPLEVNGLICAYMFWVLCYLKRVKHKELAKIEMG